MTAMDYYQKGVKLTQHDDYDGAIEVYNTGLAEYPDSYSILDRRGVAYHHKGETEKALADYTRMIALNPENPDGWNYRGNLYDELGEYDKAIADYTHCIPLSRPNYGTYWSNRGISYSHKGDLDAALADLNKSIECWGEERRCAAWPLVQRGIVWRKKGDLDRALLDFTQASIDNPKDDRPLYQAGYIYFLRQDYDKAIEWYSKAIAAHGEDADSWLARGVCYWNKCGHQNIGYWDEEGTIINLAEDDFTKAIEYAPDSPDAYFNRGMVRCNMAQECKNYIKAIISQKVSDEATRVLMLTQLELLGGKAFVPKYNALFRKLRYHRDQADIAIVEGASLMAQDHAEEAIEDLCRAIELEGNNAEAYYQRGLAYALIGDKDKALSDYEQTYALDPNHRKAGEKRDELLQSRK